MARTNNLSNFLTDVASAIKQKKGSSTAIPAANFDTEILALPSQGTYQQKAITVTTNGTQTILPDTGYDAIDELTLTTNVPSSGDIKLFDTVEHMQADPDAEDGDLAVVYGEHSTAVDETSEFDSCIFPATVIFDTAITNSTSNRYAATGSGFFDAWVSLGPTSFDFDGYGDEMVRVTYTSSDGLTYTRTDGGAETMNFGTTIKFDEDGGTFDENIAQFMKIGGMCFEGLYQFDAYNEDTSKIAFNVIDSVDVFLDTSTSNTPCYDITYEENPELIDWSYIARKEALIHDSLLKGVSYAHLLYYKDVNDNDIFLVWVDSSSTASNWTPTNGYPYFTFDINGAIKTVYSMYNSWNIVYATIDASDNVTYTFVNTPTTNTVNLASGSSYQMYNYTIPEAVFVPKAIIRDSSTGVATTVNGRGIKLELVKNGIQYVDGSLRDEINKHESDYNYAPVYKLADTQLTLNNPNKLALGEIAYGSTGIMTGTYEDSEYDTNLALSESILGGDALYTPLQYIQSSGTQYLNLNFDPIDNYNTFVFQVDMQAISFSSGTYSIFGTGNYFMGWKNDVAKVTFAPNSQANVLEINRDTNRHTFTINALIGKYSYDSQSYDFTPASAGSSTTHKPMLLFGWSSGTYESLTVNDLFSVKLYEVTLCNGYELDGTTPHVIRHLIPAKRNSDDEICMYDTVSATFFTNDGTGSFIAGPVKTN